MSNVEITPELLRAVEIAAANDPSVTADVVDGIAQWKVRLERKRSLIDELAQIIGSNIAMEFRSVPWPELTEGDRLDLRSAACAVLAKLDEERADKGGNVSKPLRQWNDLRDVPEDVETVISNSGTRIGRTVCLPQGWSWTGLNMTGVSTWWKWDAPFTEVRD
ncbi:hypothetical protein QNA24_30005 [Rhodococcus qingshengii]|uniref:hypothetical protein n=1 Tax=Rhodococcus TaxID=1827 RepID=UPI001E503D0C|nr:MULTISPECIES: hypothetical protein [Rhodococcus]MCD2099604.1 hypothetical protein [Rhodococcus rhodochrous]MCD2123972.1 hypothetical protein [Rhodococcus rhodochrous]MCQ4136596.1 hypothetical protein [Rhodococcus rhodochrous]MDJ0490618.1 hypothetical protein [Rhodococcus qingshengii]